MNLLFFYKQNACSGVNACAATYDGVAVSYIDAAVALGNTINEWINITPRKIIKTMRLRKGKIPLLLSGSHDFSETN